MSPDASGSSGPYVIGATGGSGTRVVARIVRDAGMFIGENLNVSEDAIEFGEFSDRWINTFLTFGRTLPADMHQQAVQELEMLTRRHLAGTVPGRAWGWKEPRSIFLVPFLAGCFPQLKFLHVIRDGRDMAFSANQNQTTKHGATLLDGSELIGPLGSIAVWSGVNLDAANYGERNLADRYLRIRFEDLCASPELVIRRVLHFFGLCSDASALAHHVSAPDSLGRWQEQDHLVVAQLQHIARPALERFGYLPRGGSAPPGP